MSQKNHAQLNAPISFAAQALFLMLLLSGISFAGLTDFNPATDLIYKEPMCEPAQQSILTSWMPLSMLAITISILIIGMAYMVGVALSMQKLLAWAKNELYQTAASAILIVLIVGALSMASVAASSITPGKTSVEAAKSYALKMRNTLLADFIVLSVMNNFVSAYASLNINLAPGRFGFYFQLGPALRPLLDALGLLMNSMLGAIGSWAGHELLLCFIQQNMLTVFLPWGLLLRAFPPTRSAGGALIAIAVSFFFIYPLLLTLNERIVAPHYKNMWGASSASGAALGVVGGVSSVFAVAVSSFSISGWLSYGIMLMFGGSFLISGLATTFIIAALIPVIIAFAKQVFYSVLITSIILPFFNIFLTLAFAREAAKYLGSDINLTSLTQLL